MDVSKPGDSSSQAAFSFFSRERCKPSLNRIKFHNIEESSVVFSLRGFFFSTVLLRVWYEEVVLVEPPPPRSPWSGRGGVGPSPPVRGLDWTGGGGQDLKKVKIFLLAMCVKTWAFSANFGPKRELDLNAWVFSTLRIPPVLANRKKDVMVRWYSLSLVVVVVIIVKQF